MAFYYSKRKLRPKEGGETGELNIVPYLDILMNLIIFMLLSMTGLAAFGILNVNAPNYGNAGPSAGAETPDTPKLLLTVLISKKGFYIAGANGVVGSAVPGQGGTDGAPTVPKKTDGTYDFATLNALMMTVKASPAGKAETKVILGADADISYETLVQTMDTVRETAGADHKILFPDVTLAVL